ncbi:adenosylcobinamide-phosphate synthase CobD [Acetobacter senegalensis]|uniref:Cobalamin biosynthesis protein CobD n=2 Tax=Acetobacter senegalensis TaxID=446692 RepID=A0A0U4Y085_9PROT|nr:adenosylcobinamide-phosphate synthase CobD [Acetobacter senegalensis]
MGWPRVRPLSRSGGWYECSCSSGLSCEPPARMLFFPLVTTLPVAALAAILESLWGYPAVLLGAIGHPVMWIGTLIDRLDTALNLPEYSERKRRWMGILALVVIVLVPLTVVSLVLQIGYAVLPPPVMIVVQGVLTTALVAQKSLWTHVRAVGTALRREGLAAGRQAVAQIVGRDTRVLDEADVVRAALESLAENFSDGVVAPLVWAALFGLPGAVFYKAVNTADSMIGHLTPRHAAFGMAAATVDDMINLPASRLAALCLIWAAPAERRAQARAAVRRDAPGHRSPNAGWPEAAMAGALGLRLAGPRQYGGTRVDDVWMGDGTPNATVDDLDRGLVLYRRACALLSVLLLAAAVLSMIAL